MFRFSVLLLLPAAICPASHIFTGLNPAWVDPVDYAAEKYVPEKGSSEGVRYLLFEQQENPETEEQFIRVIRFMQNETGVQDAGNLRIPFFPDYQQLTLHQVCIIRNGQRLNRLDLSAVKLIQPERELGQHLYTGLQQALLFIEDLRVNDILEISHTLRGNHPAMDGHYSSLFTISGMVPIEKQRFRVLWNNQKPLNIRKYLCSADPRRIEKDGYTGFVWDFDRQPPISYEDLFPAHYEPCPYLEFSDFQSWTDVANWAMKRYVPEDEPFPAELKTLINTWKTSGKSPAETALNALQFVQDEIRYTGIELGIRAYEPAHPFETFRLRYGDCKGKSVLLCIILKELGIEAYPALVNVALNENVNKKLPSPTAFNHVIVKLIINDQAVWVDPTQANQGGKLEQRYLPDFRYALVIRNGETGLSEVLPQKTVSELNTETVLTISSYDAAVQYHSYTTARGWEADTLRNYLARTKRQDVEQNFLNYLAITYPNISVSAPFIVNDNRSANELIIREWYTINSFWTFDSETRQWNGSVFANTLNNMLPLPDVRIRKMPLGLVHPFSRTQKLTMIFPDNTWEMPPQNQTIYAPGFLFDYSMRCHNNGSQVFIEYACSTTANQIQPADVPEFLQKRTEMQNLIFRSLQRPENQISSQPIGQINWLMVTVSLLGGAATVAICRKLWKFRRKSTHRNLGGEIQGLLVLVAIGVCIAPFIYIAQLIPLIKTAFSQHMWNSLAVSGGVQYIQGYGALLITEVLSNIFIFGLQIVTAAMFFSKRREFPVLFISVRIGSLLFAWTDALIAGQLTGQSSIDASAIANFFWTVVWCIYMLRSKQVKATFVR